MRAVASIRRSAADRTSLGIRADWERLLGYGPLPTVLHLASLPLAFGFLLVIGRRQWFIADEWKLLTDRVLTGQLDLLKPHNEHLLTVSILVYKGLFSAFGLRTYLPYLAVAILFHVVTGHLLWRLMVQVGTSRWTATALAAAFLVSGGGAFNYFLAEQTSEVGSVMAGLALILLVNYDDGGGRRRYLAALAVALASLLFSGISVVMIAVAGMIVWLRRGLRPAVALVAPVAAVYLAWVVTAGKQAAGIHQSPSGMLKMVPYVVNGLVGSVATAIYVPAFASAAVLAALVFMLVRRRSAATTRAAPVFAMAVGAVLFFTVIGLGRVALFGVHQARDGRYVYVGWLLLLPAVGMALDHVLARLDAVTRASAALGLGVILTLQGVWGTALESRIEDVREIGLRREVLAAASFIATEPYLADVAVGPGDAEGLDAGELARLARTDALPPLPALSENAHLDAAVALRVQVTAATAGQAPDTRGLESQVSVSGAVPGDTGEGCVSLRPTGYRPEVEVSAVGPAPLRVSLASRGVLTLVMRSPTTGEVSRPLDIDLEPDREVMVEIAPGRATPVLVLPAAQTVELCNVRVR